MNHGDGERSECMHYGWSRVCDWKQVIRKKGASPKAITQDKKKNM